MTHIKGGEAELEVVYIKKHKQKKNNNKNTV